MEIHGQQNINNLENCYLWKSAGYCWQRHGEWHSDTAVSERRFVAGAHRVLMSIEQDGVYLDECCFRVPSVLQCEALAIIS